jgi:DNA-binding FadR family transcriptional regulator
LHTKIIEATGNAIYLSLYESIAELLFESRRQTACFQGVRGRAHSDHVAIVAALERRDAQAAAEAMQSHLMAMRQALEDIVSGNPPDMASASSLAALSLSGKSDMFRPPNHTGEGGDGWARG